MARKPGAKKGKRLSKAHRRALSKALTGVPKTEEHKAKISAAMKGRPKSAAHRVKISEALAGVKKSPEAIENSSRARRGKPQSEEHRAKRKASADARTEMLKSGIIERRRLTPEQRLAHSIRMQERWAKLSPEDKQARLKVLQDNAYEAHIGSLARKLAKEETE